MSKLKIQRLKSDLSQSQLAEKSGLSVRVLQAYEQGARDFDGAKIETILSVCIALNCSILDVLENENILKLLDQYEKKSR